MAAKKERVTFEEVVAEMHRVIESGDKAFAAIDDVNNRVIPVVKELARRLEALERRFNESQVGAFLPGSSSGEA